MFLVMKGTNMTGLAMPIEGDALCPSVANEAGMTKSVVTIEEKGDDTILEDEKVHLGNAISCVHRLDL